MRTRMKLVSRFRLGAFAVSGGGIEYYGWARLGLPPTSNGDAHRAASNAFAVLRQLTPRRILRQNTDRSQTPFGDARIPDPPGRFPDFLPETGTAPSVHARRNSDSLYHCGPPARCVQQRPVFLFKHTFFKFNG